MRLPLLKILRWRLKTRRKQMAAPYPTVLPLDCVTYVIKTVKDRKVRENIADVAFCLWNVQGYAQNSLIGPAREFTFPTMFGEVGATSEDELVEFGQAVLDIQAELNENGFESSSLPTALPVWITLVVQVLPVVIAALRELGIIKENQ